MTIRSQIINSTTSCGDNFISTAERNCSNTRASSPRNSTSLQNNPCVTPFIDERRLPATLRGPVDF
ncbi:MAG: hypothetical protein H7Z14_19970 [Anaerolineae bacterium]|nr:hypothetical protein [Phycisphaerae bacterium]